MSIVSITKNWEKNKDKYYESADFKLYDGPNNSETPLNTNYPEPSWISYIFIFGK